MPCYLSAENKHLDERVLLVLQLMENGVIVSIDTHMTNEELDAILKISNNMEKTY